MIGNASVQIYIFGRRGNGKYVLLVAQAVVDKYQKELSTSECSVDNKMVGGMAAKRTLVYKNTEGAVMKDLPGLFSLVKKSRRCDFYSTVKSCDTTK